MKKNIKAIYLIEIALLFLTIIFYVLTKVVSSDLKSYLATTFLLIICIPSVILFGFSKEKSYYSGYAFRVVLTVLMAAAIVIYLVGILLGFTRGYHFNMHNLLYSIIPITLITLLSEILRCNVVKYSYQNKFSVFFFTAILSVFHILIETNYGVLDTPYHIFVYVSTTVFPLIAENFICTYLVYKADYRVSIFFKLVVGLYMYVLPIIPNLGYYIYAVVKVMVPYIIFYVMNKNLLQEEHRRVFIDKSRRIYSVPVLVVAVILVILISGIFKYKLIAVATDSMNPVFYRGDAVMIAYKDPNDVKVGDILAYEHKGVMITHRIIEITEDNGKLYFATKGDANEIADPYITPQGDVIGKVEYVVKYIGFPTVWTKELMERGN